MKAHDAKKNSFPGWMHQGGRGESTHLWLAPLLVALLLVALLGTLFYLNQVQHRRQVQAFTRIAGKRIQDNVQLHIHSTEEHLRIGLRRMSKNKLSQDLFHERAEIYLADHACLLALCWVPKDHHIAWVRPQALEASHLGLPLELSAQEEAWERMQQVKKAVYTAPFKTLQGKTVFEIYAPFFREETFQGALMASVSLQEILDHVILPLTPPMMHVALSRTDGSYLVGAPQEENLNLSLEQSLPFPPQGLPFQLLLTPYEGSQVSAKEWFLRSISIALALGIALAMWRLRKDNQKRRKIAALLKQHQNELEHLVEDRTRELEETNQELRTEIEERQHAQEALQVSRSFLQIIIDGVPEELLVIDSDYRVVLANKKAMALGKRKGDAGACYYCYQLSHQEDRPCASGRHTCPLNQVIATGKSAQVIHEHKSADGVIRHIEVIAEPIVDDAGKVTHIVESCRDISLRIRAEQELRLNEERLRLSLEATNDGLWDWNLSTNKVYFSPRYYSMLGYAFEELPPSVETWETLLHPEDREAALEQVQEHLQSKQAVFETEFRLREKGGGWRWIQARGNIVERDAQGQPVRMVGTHVDISDRKQAEAEIKRHQEQLMQADKMASLGLLVSGVAHEINNPNFLIMSNIQVLRSIWESAAGILERYYQEHGEFMIGGAPYSAMREEIVDLYGGILEGSDRIKHIVTELRDYAQERPAEQKDPLNLNVVLQSSMALLGNMVEKATHHFTLSYGADLPAVWGNSQRLEQVVINLVQNACQALDHPDQAIGVRTYYEHGEDWVVLEVKDEGKGIRSEDLPHLTDPFFTTKRTQGGTGLGLSICASILKAHQGSLDFDSDWGNGTCVQMKLPSAQESNGGN